MAQKIVVFPELAGISLMKHGLSFMAHMKAKMLLMLRFVNIVILWSIINMKLIYIVFEWSGEYSDYCEIDLQAFTDAEKAKSFLEEKRNSLDPDYYHHMGFEIREVPFTED